MIDQQVQEVKQRIADEKWANQLVIENNKGIYSLEGSKAMAIEQRRGISCDTKAFVDEIEQYFLGACDIPLIIGTCNRSKMKAQLNNESVLSKLESFKTSEGNRPSLGDSWIAVVKMFNSVVKSNNECSQAVQQSIVKNPICLNTMNVFFYQRALYEYASRCNEEDIDSVVDQIGEMLERHGKRLVSEIISPHTESRKLEHAVAANIIELEKIIGPVTGNNSSPQREPSSKEGL